MMTEQLSSHPQIDSAPLLSPLYFSPQIAIDLFPPSSQGERFLQHFIKEAQRETATLSDESGERLVIRLPSTAALAQRLGFAYDTTHRYLTLLQTLGLMQKHTHGRERLFILLQGRYLPPPTLATDLETLIARCSQQRSRHKYLHLLREIQARCCCLGLLWTGKEMTHTDALALMQTLTQHQEHATRRELTSRLRQIALLSRTLLLAGPTQPPDPYAESAPGREVASSPVEQTQPAEGTYLQPPGKAAMTSTRSKLPPLPQAKSPVASSIAASEGVVADGRIQRNVTSLYHAITTSTLRSPEQLAHWFAEQFEHDQTAFRKYLKLFEQATGIPRDPHVLAAAFFCTMVRLHRDRWNITARPGGFFTKRCREYDAGIPDEVAGWITRYGHLSLDTLLSTLHAEAETAHTARTRPAQHSSTPTSAPVQTPRSASLPVTPTWVTAPPSLARETPVTPDAFHLRQEEAQALIACIRQDRRTCAFRFCLLHHQESGRYAVLVDATRSPGRVRQTIVYSLEDWQARLARMEHWLDLFAPTEPTGQKASVAA